MGKAGTAGFSCEGKNLRRWAGVLLFGLAEESERATMIEKLESRHAKHHLLVFDFCAKYQNWLFAESHLRRLSPAKHTYTPLSPFTLLPCSEPKLLSFSPFPTPHYTEEFTIPPPGPSSRSPLTVSFQTKKYPFHLTFFSSFPTSPEFLEPILLLLPPPSGVLFVLDVGSFFEDPEQRDVLDFLDMLRSFFPSALAACAFHSLLYHLEPPRQPLKLSDPLVSSTLSDFESKFRAQFPSSPMSLFLLSKKRNSHITAEAQEQIHFQSILSWFKEVFSLPSPSSPQEP